MAIAGSCVSTMEKPRFWITASPGSQTFCSPKTLTRDGLDVWPALPLIIEGDLALSSSNIVAALEQSDRVCRVYLPLTNQVLTPMQVPFPKLTVLQLWSNDETPVIPDSFLGGSAPRLQYLNMNSIPFPGLPKLLLSATHLTHLHLDCIPHSGYISPQAMVTPLSVLSSLRTLYLRFQSPQSRPDWESPSLPPPRRPILPALIERCCRILRGTRDPHRHPSTRCNGYKVL